MGCKKIIGKNKKGYCAGDPFGVLRPLQITGLNDIVDVSMDQNSAIILNSNGCVYGIGYNDVYQLGSKSFNNTTQPIKIPELTNIISISMAGDTSFF